MTVKKTFRVEAIRIDTGALATLSFDTPIDDIDNAKLQALVEPFAAVGYSVQSGYYVTVQTGNKIVPAE